MAGNGPRDLVVILGDQLDRNSAALHVIARLPVRQWVRSVPKRLRYHLEHDPAFLNTALHCFVGAIERTLRQASPGANAKSRLGGIVFLHRFGASLFPHLHFSSGITPLRGMSLH